MKSSGLSFWRTALQSGLLGGAIALLMCLVGMVLTFGKTYIINGIFTMGDLLLLAPVMVLTYSAARRLETRSSAALFALGSVSGLLSGVLLTILVLIGQSVNLRAMFINASPNLYQLLTLGKALPAGAFIPIVRGLIAGILAIILYILPQRIRPAILQAIGWIAAIGILKDQILLTNLARFKPLGAVFGYIFATSGFSPAGGAIIFVLIAGLVYWRMGRKSALKANRPLAQQRSLRVPQLILVAVILLLLPPILGIFFSEILDNSGLYILMGLGLNIVVGFAGLLDLGYVAFYAIGAYVMGVLTSTGLGLFSLNFWQALPFALIVAIFAGFVLGLPVLRMRGDYLAIVTLGFGEIVRLLALSDWLKPWLGGTQGIQRISQPQLGAIKIDTLQELYYFILVGIAIVAFIAWRLKDSRLGRAWMAIREDEDVAQAMGINLVATKLMAFMTGALFAGLGGTLGAAKLTSVYPHSMTFLVSINILCLIIIGGMGSIPGVFVGALVLIGLPGLLTEFEEFRFLVYGAALVFMMLTRPEGLWPEARRRLELHEEAGVVEEESLAPATTIAD